MSPVQFKMAVSNPASQRPQVTVVVQEEQPWPHLETFFTTERDEDKGDNAYIATCSSCRPKVTKICIYKDTLNNISRHYKSAHPFVSDSFKEAISKGSKRGNKGTTRQCEVNASETPTKRQSTLSFGTPHFATQDECNKLFLDMVVNDMLPLNFCNSPCLKEWVHALNPSRDVMSASTAMRHIRTQYEDRVTDLNQLLAHAQVVSTTADCWTSKYQRRDYLGMTAHWINIENGVLVRKKAVLVCKELLGSHTFHQLATEISNVHNIFNLEKKTVTTTTDNATNFAKAFSVFGTENDMFPNVPEIDSDLRDQVSEADADIDESEDIDPRGLYEGFHGLDEEIVDEMSLPKHQRCAAHTLNLVATTDLQKVPGWGYQKTCQKGFAKANALWKKQNRCTAVSNRIKEELGRKLPCPSVVRWNSLLDSFSVLKKMFEDDEKRRKLLKIMDETPGLERFNLQEIELIKEYVEVMSPVAVALDILQGEEHAYTGVLLPTIFGLMEQLSQLRDRVDRPLKYMKAVVSKLLISLQSDRRFGKLLSDDELLLGTAFHPLFKVPHIKHMQPERVDEIKQKMVNILKGFVDIDADSSINRTAAVDHPAKKPRFWRIVEPSSSGTHERVEMSLRMEVESWIDPLDEMVSPNIHMFPNLNQNAWVKAFVQYNTAIPSSAAVERLFSMGSDIMGPKRTRLTSKNFEVLVFLKGNNRLLK